MSDSDSTDYSGTLIHCLITLVGCIFGIGWYVVAFYIGREEAQAEYRYIEDNGGKRADCPWYCGLLPSAWTTKGLLDWILPLCVALAWDLLGELFGDYSETITELCDDIAEFITGLF